MIIAFTGPRAGITIAQKNQLLWAMRNRADRETVFHHGVCVGADQQFHMLLEQFLIDHPYVRPMWRLEMHPCTLASMVATDLRVISLGIPVTIHAPIPPLDRNIVMAQECHRLWATPVNLVPMHCGGTWHTIRHVQRMQKPVDFFVAE